MTVPFARSLLASVQMKVQRDIEDMTPNSKGRVPASGRIESVSFWRKEVIDFALDRETQAHVDEQRAWIQREPGNARPYYHLAQLYRVAFKQDEALGLLLRSEERRVRKECAS